jgi:hypothetical protein
VTFMDCMLQSWLLVDDTRSLFVPIEIQKLTINIGQHIIYLQSLDVNADRGRFEMCFFCTCGRECIGFVSSILLLCEVVSLGMGFLMCWIAMPSKHGSPHV